MGRTQRENDAWNGGLCAGGGGDGTDGWGWSDASSSRALELESEQASPENSQAHAGSEGRSHVSLGWTVGVSVSTGSLGHHRDWAAFCLFPYLQSTLCRHLCWCHGGSLPLQTKRVISSPAQSLGSQIRVVRAPLRLVLGIQPFLLQIGSRRVKARKSLTERTSHANLAV